MAEAAHAEATDEKKAPRSKATQLAEEEEEDSEEAEEGSEEASSGASGSGASSGEEEGSEGKTMMPEKAGKVCAFCTIKRCPFEPFISLGPFVRNMIACSNAKIKIFSPNITRN